MNPTSEPECQPERIQGLHQLTIAVWSVSFAVAVVASGLVLWTMAFRMPRTITTIWFLPSGLRRLHGLTANHHIQRGHWPEAPHSCSLQALHGLLGHPPLHQHLAPGPHLPGPLHLRRLPDLIFRDVENQKGCEYCSFKFATRARNDSKAVEGRVVVTLIHILLSFLAPLVIIRTCAHLIRTRLRQEGCAHARRLKRLLLVL
ncbi:hypothetical protein AB1E18_013694 [Capra hircus]